MFTPKGDVMALPAGSTPVDFAYAVHTEVGHRTMGARVNGRLVPLDSTLENGDVVDVFTSKSETAGPSRDWLGFVKSPRARNKIRQWFSKERREEAIEHGKDAIAKAMRKQNLPIQRLLSHEALVALAHEMRYADVSGLYAAVGEGQVSAATVVQRLVHAMGGEPGAEEDIAETARPGPDRAPGPHRRPGRRGQGRRRHLGQARQVLHAGARATRSSASSPAVRASACTASDCVNVDEPAGAARAHRRGRRGRRAARRAVPRADPGRGARPQPAAVGRHPGAVRPPRRHPLRDGLDDARPGRACRSSCSRWPSPGTSRRCSPRSARSTASSTSTGSRGPRRAGVPAKNG